MHWLNLTLAVLANTAANLAFKTAALSGHGDASRWKSLIVSPWMWAGAASCVVLLACYLMAIRRIDLPVAYACVTCASLVLITLASVPLFHTALSVPQMMGIGAVVTGIALLVFG